MTKKLHIKTCGCQMNEYDSSKMADLLESTHGYELTEVAEEADVLLLNTCSIREKAQEKVFHQLGRWRALEYKAIIRKLRSARPDIHISSDFIIGFPGETQEDFEQTMKLIGDVNFDMSFSFICSARPGTPAADMVDDVSEEEKKQRLYILQERISQQAMQFSRRMLGSIQRILVEGTSRKSVM